MGSVSTRLKKEDVFGLHQSQKVDIGLVCTRMKNKRKTLVPLPRDLKTVNMGSASTRLKKMQTWIRLHQINLVCTCVKKANICCIYRRFSNCLPRECFHFEGGVLHHCRRKREGGKRKEKGNEKINLKIFFSFSNLLKSFFSKS